MFRYRDYIYCVYQEKSFTRAAEKLHISQPSLSITVSKEEKLAGHPIFNRKTTPVTLTPFGAEYIRCIEKIREMENQTQSLASDYNLLQTGTLSIGASNLSMQYFLPRIMAEFKLKYPNVVLHIEDTNTIDAKQKLDAGMLDIIISNRPFNRFEYESIPIYQEQLILAVPKSYPINELMHEKRLCQNELGSHIFSIPKQKLVQLKDFCQVPFILLSNGNYIRSCTDMLFREADFEPNVVMEFEQSAISCNFACYGIGATIFSNRFAEESELPRNLVLYAIDSQYAKRNGYAYYRKGSYVTAAMAEFLNCLQSNELSELDDHRTV